MKDDDKQEIPFIEALLTIYTGGLEIFKENGLLPKIDMVQSQIGQEIIPMHFHELNKLDKAKSFEYSKSISLEDMHKNILHRLSEELSISYGFVEYSLEQIFQLLNKIQSNKTIYVNEIELCTICMNNAYYHFGLADQMYQLCLVSV